MAFTTWAFFAAGLVCAAVPILIHLLNRRRARTVNWAAMELLREAQRRTRRKANLRDLILLSLRCLAVLCFGSALARPFFPPADANTSQDESQPLHAILLIDNSMSMGYQTLSGNLLQEAKQLCKQLIERLPRGSVVSVEPLCGSTSTGFSSAYAKEEAKDVVDRVAVVDRDMNLLQAQEIVHSVQRREPHKSPQIVLLTDQQRANWDHLTRQEHFAALPAMHVIGIGPAQRENTSISDFYVQDGIADKESLTTFVVSLRHHASQARNVQISLSADEASFATKTVRLEPGARQDIHLSCRLASVIASTVDELDFLAVKATITPDRLRADDERFLVIPLVREVPVVFVDQYGADRENKRIGRVGATSPFRHLLAPKASERTDGQMIAAGHVRLDQLSLSQLNVARLVVVAGVAEPSNKLSVLHSYVERGGQLVIVASSDFDPAAWNRSSELDGVGLLAGAKLADETSPLAAVESGQSQPLQLSYESMRSQEYFQLPGCSEQQIRDLFALPVFFRHVGIRVPSDATNAKVLAQFDNEQKSPYLAEWRIGRGRVLLVTSPLDADYSTIHLTDAMLIFDRVLRHMIESTLPRRNFATGEQIVVPFDRHRRATQLALHHTGSDEFPLLLDTSFVTRNRLGVTIPERLNRGIYRLSDNRDSSDDQQLGRIPKDVLLAANVPPEESDLAPLSVEEIRGRAGESQQVWLNPSDPLPTPAALAHGRDLWWKVLIVAVLALVIAEMIVIVAPAFDSQPSESRPETAFRPDGELHIEKQLSPRRVGFSAVGTRGS